MRRIIPQPILDSSTRIILRKVLVAISGKRIPLAKAGFMKDSTKMAINMASGVSSGQMEIIILVYTKMIKEMDMAARFMLMVKLM